MSLDISETLDRTIKSWIKEKLTVTERVKIKEKIVHVGDISKAWSLNRENTLSEKIINSAEYNFKNLFADLKNFSMLK